MQSERRERLEIVLSPEQLDYLDAVRHDHDLIVIIHTITDALISCEEDYTNARDELEALKGDPNAILNQDWLRNGGSLIP